jgi:hypothetical protein
VKVTVYGAPFSLKGSWGTKLRVFESKLSWWWPPTGAPSRSTTVADERRGYEARVVAPSQLDRVSEHDGRGLACRLCGGDRRDRRRDHRGHKQPCTAPTGGYRVHVFLLRVCGGWSAFSLEAQLL